MQKSALVYENISKYTPITIKIYLDQPYILTSSSQKLPFIVEVKNVGLGKSYSDTFFYPFEESTNSYVRLHYKSNSTLVCDFDDGDLLMLINGSRRFACKLIVSKDEVNDFANFGVDFSLSYGYLDKVWTKIDVE